MISNKGIPKHLGKKVTPLIHKATAVPFYFIPIALEEPPWASIPLPQPIWPQNLSYFNVYFTNAQTNPSSSRLSYEVFFKYKIINQHTVNHSKIRDARGYFRRPFDGEFFLIGMRDRRQPSNSTLARKSSFIKRLETIRVAWKSKNQNTPR